MVQYKTSAAQEPPRRLVSIQSVDTVNLKAIGAGINYSGQTNIDLSIFTPPIIQYPRVGEQWYVALVKQKWVLDKKSNQGSEGFLQSPVSAGDEVWNVGNNLDITVQGVLSLADQNGSLVTQPPRSWLPITLGSGWAQTSGYALPAARLDADNYVHLRGNLTWAATSSLPSPFPVFTLPESCAPAVQMMVSAVSSLSGTGFRLLISASGVATVAGYSVTTGPVTLGIDGIVFPSALVV
jgi:hypothetical protein